MLFFKELGIILMVVVAVEGDWMLLRAVVVVIGDLKRLLMV